MSLISHIRTHRRVLFPVFVFLFLLLLFALTPLTHDDWYYESGFSLRQLLTTQSVSWYQHLNGRILGNGLEGLTGGHKLLRAALQAGFVLGIWEAACSLLKLSAIGQLLFLAGMMLLPSGLYAQTYGWGAGYFNYVPELMLLLSAAWLICRWTSGHCRSHAACGAAAFLCALCAQLHSENFTAISMLLGVILLVLCATPVLRKNRAALLCGIGFLVGGALMFAAPAYRSADYYTVSTDLWERILENYELVSFYALGYHYIASLLLTSGAVYLLWNRDDRLPQAVKSAVTAALVLLQVYFIGYHLMLEDNLVLHSHLVTKWLDFAANAVYVLLIFFCTLHCSISLESKCLTLIPLALAILYAGPLLVVSPIGPRCFYASWILMLFSGAALFSAAFRGKISFHGATWTACSACAGALLFLLFITLENHGVYRQRMDAIAQGMAAHADAIALRDYPYPEYVWGNNSQTIGVHYYYAAQNDITFTYYPYYDLED